MKLRLIVCVNYFFALISVVLVFFFSGLSLSPFLPIIFPQFAVLVALLKYVHVKNVLKAAGDSTAINSTLKLPHAVILISVAVALLGFAIIFFHLDMEYKVIILVSGDLAILTLVSIFVMLYPVLVKLDSGIYRKVTK
ncbi:TPA: hypothetical protein RQN91_005523 [Klebsiella michiganensis]|nr:hypothetical protein [Klebsiella michiganensis]